MLPRLVDAIASAAQRRFGGSSTSGYTFAEQHTKRVYSEGKNNISRRQHQLVQAVSMSNALHLTEQAIL
jgi:hypothetical protein